MAKIIRRTPISVRDLEEIADHLADRSLNSALRFLEEVEATIAWIAEHPAGGSLFRSTEPALANVRIMRVRNFPNHAVFYREQGGAVHIVRILHAARDYEAELRRG